MFTKLNRQHLHRVRYSVYVPLTHPSTVKKDAQRCCHMLDISRCWWDHVPYRTVHRHDLGGSTPVCACVHLRVGRAIHAQYPSAYCTSCLLRVPYTRRRCLRICLPTHGAFLVNTHVHTDLNRQHLRRVRCVNCVCSTALLLESLKGLGALSFSHARDGSKHMAGERGRGRGQLTDTTVCIFTKHTL